MGSFLARTAATVGGLIAVTPVLIAFLLFNGGFVYRTTCPLAGGGQQTTWSQGLFDVLPYTRQTEPPCEADTLTRVALNSVGLFEESDPGAGQIEVTAADQRAVSKLSEVVTAISDQFKRERTLIAPFQEKADRGEITDDDREAALAMLEDIEATYEATREEIRDIPEADDDDLREARGHLLRWAEFQIASMRILRTSGSGEETREALEEEYEDIPDVGNRLSVLGAILETRYDDAGDWSFLKRS